MQVPHADTHLPHVIRQVLRHALGQRGDHHLVARGGLLVYLGDKVIDLPCHRPHINLRIQQSGRTDDLLRPQRLMLFLIIAGRGGHEHHLVQLGLPLREVQRPVIQRRGQTEAVVYQHPLSCLVPVVHAAHLRHRHVGLIDDQQKVLREIIHQRVRRGTGRKSGQMTRIVLDAGAEACLPHHLHVEIGAFRDALRLDQLIVRAEILHPFLQLRLDILRGLRHALRRDHIVGRREDGHMIQTGLDLSGQRVDLCNAVDLIPEEFNADGLILRPGCDQFDHIAPHAEGPAVKIHVIALVLDLDQLFDDLVPVPDHARPQRNDHVLIINGAAQAIDAGNRRHNDHIPPLGKCGRSRVTQTVDLVIDGGVLGNIGIRGGNISLRLIIIIVGNKVFHRVVGEEFLEFTVQLGRQRFVVGQHQGGTVQLLYDIGHGEGLSRSRDAKQRLGTVSLPEAIHQGLDGLRLIPGRRIFRYQFKMIHTCKYSFHAQAAPSSGGGQGLTLRGQSLTSVSMVT